MYGGGGGGGGGGGWGGGGGSNLRTLSREYDCLVNIGTRKVFTLLLGN